jgi:hypothetical protein
MWKYFSVGKFLVSIAINIFLIPNLVFAEPLPTDRFLEKKINNGDRAGKLVFNLNKSSRVRQSYGRPPNRTSGGSRGACQGQLIALVPGKEAIDLKGENCDRESESLLTLSINPAPTLWFYIPAYDRAALVAELVLLNDREEFLSKQTISLEGKVGIVGIALDRQLEVEREYRWQLSILVDGDRPSENPSVEGVIKYILPSLELKKQLALTTTLRQKLEIYSREGIWQEAISSLIELKQQIPQEPDFSNDWQTFLNSVGLAIEP